MIGNRTFRRLRLGGRRTWRWLTGRFLRVLGADAEPKVIAVGAAAGVFAASLPLPFLQMALALTLATLLGGSRLAAGTFVWTANPLFWYGGYVVGRRLLRWFCPAFGSAGLSWGAFRQGLGQEVFLVLRRICVPLLVGSFLLGLAIAVLTYFVALWVALRLGGAERGETAT